ncbi:band 7 protein AGAP004871-like isoform X1 [Nilaparvata lugens]|uniref:band 7 protein AGAP004871-like isoform X1 n=1 Tax=Nilaparvata lugens TaxID=108931 RepID=UPI00193DA4AF|nr:band 7 protein AGAP004871-like isoform X1 [Nilaparvata lugens]
MSCIEIIATVGSIILFIVTFPISVFMSFKIVQEYERAVIFRLGRVRTGGARGPGIFFILPCIDSYCKVDLRTGSFDVPPQEVLTRDSVTVHVDAVVFYRVSSPTMATNNVEDFRYQKRKFRKKNYPAPSIPHPLLLFLEKKMWFWF